LGSTNKLASFFIAVATVEADGDLPDLADAASNLATSNVWLVLKLQCIVPFGATVGVTGLPSA
jgi:hypothetical protein